MRAQFEPLTLNGYSYDPRTVAAPLEALALRAAIAGRGSREAGLEATFLLDNDAVLDDRTQRVHSIAFEGGVHGRVCSCGLVMHALDPVTASGHLDTDTWRRADLIVVVHDDPIGPGNPASTRRFAVVCHACGWAVPARSPRDGHSLGDAHDCSTESRPVRSIAALHGYLGLS